MLERATACLKSGATRDSLRCRQGAPRSKRMLHSTFWNHGAGALDIPPWELSMFPWPSNPPSTLDSTRSPRSESKKKIRLEITRSSGTTQEWGFLDFLYPPQALAWLQRASASQQLQRWERRNLRRLPEGFVVTSRGYSSRSYQPFSSTKVEAEAQEQEALAYETNDNQHRLSSTTMEGVVPLFDLTNKVPRDEGEVSRNQNIDVGSSKSGEQETERLISASQNFEFADSPGALAESMPDRFQELRHILTSTRNSSINTDPVNSQALTERTWKIFESLSEGSKGDIRLREELLGWLALRCNAVAEERCEELYESIPAGERSLEVYTSMLSMLLRQEQLHLASQLHKEALQNLQNGYLITRTLFKYAVDHQRWQLAVRTVNQHDTTYSERNQVSQIRVFWLHISEMPQLLEKAVRLAMYYRGKKGLVSADSSTRAFCARFFKEAISQQFLRPNEEPESISSWENFPNSQAPQTALRTLFEHIADMDKDAARLFEDTMLKLVRADSGVNYTEFHYVVSSMYRRYRALPAVLPPRRLLYALLYRLTRHEMKLRTNWESNTSIGIDTIVNDWINCHRQLSREAVDLLLAFYAKGGDVEKFEHWLGYLRSVYPDYRDHGDILWTTIYIHARRGDLDNAQQAFSEVKRIASENNDEPNIKCWNVLLHAHARSDDLEGALTNFHNLIDHGKLKPTSYSFNPLFGMLARRGDVDGLEDLLHQYDQLVGDERDVMMLMHLMEAHVYNDNLSKAESILRETREKVRLGEVRGSITRCCNVLLFAHAERRDIDATMRTYQWMKGEGINLNADSFAALVQVLTYYRQTGAAYKILTTVMREHNVEPTALHYGMIMIGLVKKRQYEDALKLHTVMSRRRIRPTMATNVAYLQAKSSIEHRESSRDLDEDGHVLPLETSIKDLQELMERFDGEEVAAKQKKFLVNTADQPAADPAAYFDTLIRLHGQRKCLEAVQDLFEQYKESAKKRGLDEENPPIRILSALMSAHCKASEYDKVEEYWKLAKDQADQASPPVPVPSFKHLFAEDPSDVDPLELQPSGTYPSEQSEIPIAETTPQTDGTPIMEPKQTLLLDKDMPKGRRPAPSRRHVLNRPLYWYLSALSAQSRIAVAITTVSRLLTQGYQMNKSTWNHFIQCLLSTSPPLALLAFILTERFLIAEFPGWKRTTKYKLPRQARYEGLQHIRARYLRKDQLMPQYKTFVRLGAAMLDIRRLEALGRRGLKTNVPPELQRFVGTTGEIRKRAAKTLFAVQSMPTVADKIQAKYLRRELS